MPVADRPTASRRGPGHRVRRLWLEWRKRLPGYERIGTPVNNVGDCPIVPD